ncbi:MAG: NAD(P)-dependent oxidoreductase [Cyanobacteria bacterium J06635_1]
MKVFITGASGFLGQYVVAEALRQGHEVIALVRPKTNVQRFSWHRHPHLTLVRIDLRQSEGLSDALAGVDAVIHLAAAKAGDFFTQFAGTVLATENLLSAMASAGVSRLVDISTFSVYDNFNMRHWQTLDESSPLITEPENYSEYAQTKLLQENLVREFEAEHQAQVTIIRPGMVYGRDNIWHALLGAELGANRWLMVGSKTIMPMTYVENCAEAIVQTLSAPAAVGKTLNIVDNDLPTQRQYTQAILCYTDEPPKMTSVSWLAVRTVSNLAQWVNQQILGGKARMPGLLVPTKVQSRFKPLRYSNAQAKQCLSWSPRYSLETALERSCNQEDLLTVVNDKAPVGASS